MFCYYFLFFLKYSLRYNILFSSIFYNFCYISSTIFNTIIWQFLGFHMANLHVSLPLLSVGEIFVGHCNFHCCLLGKYLSDTVSSTAVCWGNICRTLYLPLLSVGEIFVGHCIFQHSLFFTGIFQKLIYLFISSFILFTYLLLRYVLFNSAVSSSNYVLLNNIKKSGINELGKMWLWRGLSIVWGYIP